MIPVFLSSDNNYAPFVATTIASICDNTKSYINFYILDGGINDENKSLIESLKDQFNNFSIEFIQIDMDKYFENFIETKTITKSMYNRFLIPELKPEIDKAIYLDVDIIALDDITKLYNEDLENYSLGAVWEEFAEKTSNIKRKNVLGLPDNHKYFCSGTLLINCKKWREENIISKLLEIEKICKDSLTNPDQDILNKCFENNYKQLPAKYCYINQNYYFFESHNVVIRHYNGMVKPWHINWKTDLMSNVDDFWHYAQKTPFIVQLIKGCDNKELQQKTQSLLTIYDIIGKNNIKINK